MAGPPTNPAITKEQADAIRDEIDDEMSGEADLKEAEAEAEAGAAPVTAPAVARAAVAARARAEAEVAAPPRYQPPIPGIQPQSRGMAKGGLVKRRDYSGAGYH